jgi:hypothetical protein
MNVKIGIKIYLRYSVRAASVAPIFTTLGTAQRRQVQFIPTGQELCTLLIYVDMRPAVQCNCQSADIQETRASSTIFRKELTEFHANTVNGLVSDTMPRTHSR